MRLVDFRHCLRLHNVAYTAEKQLAEQASVVHVVVPAVRKHEQVGDAALGEEIEQLLYLIFIKDLALFGELHFETRKASDVFHTTLLLPRWIEWLASGQPGHAPGRPDHVSSPWPSIRRSL